MVFESMNHCRHSLRERIAKLHGDSHIFRDRHFRTLNGTRHFRGAKGDNPAELLGEIAV